MDVNIHDFWGQLWYIPNRSPNPRGKPRVSEKERENLCWVRREIWEKGNFRVEDCFPIGPEDVWDKQPHNLEFAQKVWGEGFRRSFSEVVKQGMANRGRGRGPRPTGDEWSDWGGGGWPQYPPNPYPPHMGHQQFFSPPPPPPQPYGFFPQGNPPPHHYFGQGARPRGGGRQGGGRGRGVGGRGNIQPPRQEPEPKKAEIEQGSEDTQKMAMEVEDKDEVMSGPKDKFQDVVCFKCGDVGHYSTACNRPKCCFICKMEDHVVEKCP